MPDLEIIHAKEGKREGVFPCTPISSLPQAIGLAQLAQKEWAATSLTSRVESLKKLAQIIFNDRYRLAELISNYNGKPLAEALTCEIIPVLASFDYFCRQAPKTLKTQSVWFSANPFAKGRIHFEPLGVIGVISPWNFPFMLSLIDLPVILLSGNALILKPSEYSTKIAQEIQLLMEKADLPKFLVQLIFGYGDLGEALIGSGINKVVFTGSSDTGKKVYAKAAQAMIPCTLEMGGKDAAIILEDADLEKSANGILWAMLCNAGQACASVETVFFPASKQGEVLQAFKKALEKVPAENLGLMNVSRQREIVLNQVKDALKKGGRVFAEKKNSNPAHPLALDVSLFVDLSKQSQMQVEETFGPTAVFVSYESIEALKKEVETGGYGLTASLWTENMAQADHLASILNVGVVSMGDHLITAGMPEMPWGGRKKSGLGFSRSRFAFQEFTQMKAVFSNSKNLKKRFWQFPYSRQTLTIIETYFQACFAEKRFARFIQKAILFFRLYV